MSSKEQKIPDEQVSEDMKRTKDTLKQQTHMLETQIDTQEVVDMLNPRIEELEKQLTEVLQRERDSLLRSKAELENVRRRADQDVEKSHKFALEKFSSALLPVIDNLERALELADKNNNALLPMIEGIELTLKSLLDVVAKFGIKVVDEIAVPFNPEIHQAMTMLESADSKPGHVISIMQNGYTLNGRLLRPAMVVVSKEKT